jgi:hypothetical protein
MSRLTRVIGKFSTVGTGENGAYQVTRITAALPGSDGRIIQPTSETFPIIASEQPVTGRDLQILPEGYMASESKNLFTTTALRTVNQDGAGSADYVTIDQHAYIAINVKRWSAFRGLHYIVLVSRRAVS